MNSLYSLSVGAVKERRRDALVPTGDLGRAVQEAAQSAVAALRKFYERPLPDQMRWAYADEVEGPARFVRALGETPSDLVSFCRRTLDYESLKPDEAQALHVLIAIYDGFKIGSIAEISSAASVFQWSDHRCAMEETDRRLVDRSSTAVAADVRYRGLQHQVVLRNLSSRGAMVEGLQDTELGETASIDLPEKGWIEGVVAWSVENRCGIAFNDPAELETTTEK